MGNRNMENNNILLVDDEEGIRKVLKITLEDAGYNISLASDGKAGFDTFVREKPNVVITDIKMPGIDGIELLKKIKAFEPETEVIMITGHGDMELAVKSLKHEAADFISKPIENGNLASAIEKARERISITRNIKKYMDNLENLVEEKKKKIDESEKLATIGQTIAGMSHAIKNISGGLKGSSFVLEQGIKQENKKYLYQGWEMMKGNIDKITKLSLDLLNYAKTTRLNFALENPNKPVREIFQLMKHKAKEKAVQLKLTACSEKKLVEMDSDAIHTCLLNLIVNAFDSFSEKTQINHENRIDVGVSIENNMVVYNVMDNGCGIDDATQRAVFHDFITTKGMNGTGFGLMTSKKIVEEHNGEIGFSSKKGEGSQFVIKIPLRHKEVI